ncbi:DNA methyltransferase, partial [Kingella kingae]
MQERILTEENKNFYGVLISDLWIDEVFQTSSLEGGVTFKKGKKPEKLIKRIIELTTNENDIVLDYHLGSGTTAAVAHKMNRQYIGIEQMDYIETLAVERLKK